MRTCVQLLLVLLTEGGLLAQAGECESESGWLGNGESCYFTSNKASLAEDSWHRAREYCMEHGGDLASIHSPGDTAFILDMANENDFQGELWTGLNQLADREKDFRWTDGTNVDYQPWAVEQPSPGGLELCAFMRTQLEDKEQAWYSANCGEKKGFVCQKAPGSESAVTVAPTPEVPGYCPRGYWGFSNKCYKLVSMQYPAGVTWDEALKKCRSEPGIQPDLASLDTPQEQAAVTARFTKHSWGYWIGYRQVGGQWLWSDNADPEYTNWGNDNMPWNECTEIRTSPAGSWNRLGCDDRRGYICQVYKDINNFEPTPGLPPSQSCAPGWSPYRYGCYQMERLPRAWPSADQHCRTLGGHLASVIDEPENAYLLATAGKDTPLWIGLQKVDQEYVWTDGWPALFSKWAAGQPAGGGGGCVALGLDSRWEDTGCSQEHPYICKIATVPAPTTPAPRDGRCPGDDWEEFGGLCYYFSAVSGATELGSAADQQCHELAGSAFNGRLAAVHDAYTNEWLYRKLKGRSTYDGSWIGLVRTDLESPWEWTDGSAATYFNWAPGEPNGELGHELCAEMWVTSWPGLWNDHHCTEYKPYICMAEKVVLTTTPALPPQGPGSCPTDDWLHYGEHCFLFKPDDFQSWTAAQELCTEQGAQLASVRNADENWFVANSLREGSRLPTAVEAWIGLAQKEEGADFKWLDDTVFTYKNWAPGEPNGPRELCVEMYASSGEWNDHFCEEQRGYICKYKKVIHTESSTAKLTAPTPTMKELDSNDDMSAGAVVGIIFGVLLSLSLLGIAGYFSYDYWRKRQLPEEVKGFSNHSYDNFKNDPNV